RRIDQGGQWIDPRGVLPVDDVFDGFHDVPLILELHRRVMPILEAARKTLKTEGTHPTRGRGPTEEFRTRRATRFMGASGWRPTDGRPRRRASLSCRLFGSSTRERHA